MTGKLKWNGEPVEIVALNERERMRYDADYIVYIIADGETADCYPCRASSVIIDD